jgi:hypothetical protein
MSTPTGNSMPNYALERSVTGGMRRASRASRGPLNAGVRPHKLP